MEMTKKCSTCRKDKPTSNFAKNSTKKDGLSSSCRDCKAIQQRQWYERHKSDHKSKVRKRNNRLVQDHRDKIGEYLKKHPCVDCGESDLVVLEFDHVRGEKISEVCKLVGSGYSWEIVFAEIEKCEVRCANCHRRITAKRRKAPLAQ